ncbi:hypothetical protein Tco_1578643 [Tanacetum coccineum]
MNIISVQPQVYSPPSSIPLMEYAPTAYPQQQQYEFSPTRTQYPGIPEGQATQTVITHNAAYQVDDLDEYDSHCDELNTVKVALMANLFYYDLAKNQKGNVQNSNSSLKQDALILSVIEQLKTQVINCTKINLDNKSVNDTLTAELERYKEQVKVLKEGKQMLIA